MATASWPVSAAPAKDGSQDEAPPEPQQSHHSLFSWHEGKAHMVGLRMDLGRANALGVGYVHAHWFGIGWFGYGADVAIHGADFGAVDALSGMGVVRLVIGHSPPMAMELAAGAGRDGDHVVAMGRAGAFFSFLYVDLGYVYSMPLGSDRPDWLSSHQFALRVHIPVHWYDTHAL